LPGNLLPELANTLQHGMVTARLTSNRQDSITPLSETMALL